MTLDVSTVTYFHPLSKHLPQCFKTLTYHKIKTLNIQLQLQMYTHFTQLYIAGNLPYLIDVVRISGREWGPTLPSHHLKHFPLNRLYTKLAKSQTVRNTLK